MTGRTTLIMCHGPRCRKRPEAEQKRQVVEFDPRVAGFTIRFSQDCMRACETGPNMRCPRGVVSLNDTEAAIAMATSN